MSWVVVYKANGRLTPLMSEDGGMTAFRSEFAAHQFACEHVKFLPGYKIETVEVFNSEPTSSNLGHG